QTLRHIAGNEQRRLYLAVKIVSLAVSRRLAANVKRIGQLQIGKFRQVKKHVRAEVHAPHRAAAILDIEGRSLVPVYAAQLDADDGLDLIAEVATGNELRSVRLDQH